MNKNTGVVVSAPGKVYLMGEHAVVYGKPALLAAINLRAYVAVENGKEGVEIVSSEPSDYIRHAVEVVKQEFKLSSLPAMKITVTSDIPAGYHLGSSAAVAVATVGATMYFIKKIWNPVSINQLAYEVEKKKHGTPSGGDNAAATFGGLIWYRKELEFLRSIWQLPFRMNEKLKPFYLVDTGRPKESTGEMVEYVASSVKRQASRLEELFNQNELETKRVAAAIKEGNEGELISAIKTGERSLEGMGVVSKKVITFLRLLEEAGGAGKILGGGGRHDGVGFLLCYHADQTRLDGLVKKYGFTMKDVLLGQEGVRLEKKL